MAGGLPLLLLCVETDMQVVQGEPVGRHSSNRVTAAAFGT